jgi:hypothetical protein
MSNRRPTHAPTFARSHDEPEPGVVRTGPLGDTEVLGGEAGPDVHWPQRQRVGHAPAGGRHGGRQPLALEGKRSYDGAVAQCIVLSLVFVFATALGVLGACFAIRSVGITVELDIVDPNDGTAEVVKKSYDGVRLREYRRRRAELPAWRRNAIDAQLLVAAGVTLSGLGSIVWLWWP